PSPGRRGPRGPRPRRVRLPRVRRGAGRRHRCAVHPRRRPRLLTPSCTSSRRNPMSTTTPSTLRLAVIEGDGIGKEVVPQGLRALQAALEPLGVAVETTDFDLGAGRWHRTGETLTDEDMAALAEHDAILLGAVGDPGVPSGVLERGLLLKLRFAFDHFVNLRPTRLFPGVASPLAEPGEMDFVVVREGTEGPYVGNGGSLRTGTDLEVATEVSLNTAVGVERVVRYAFEQAERRRRKLTL